MDNQRRLQVANRIDLLLRRELGQGIDVARTLDDALYARDVLLVCDALTEGELPTLSRMFRTLARAEESRPSRGNGASPLASIPAGDGRRQRTLGHSEWPNSSHSGFAPSQPAPALGGSGHAASARAGRPSRWPWPWR